MFRKNRYPGSADELVYHSPITFKDYKHTIWNLVTYVYIFVLWMYLSVAYYNFGKYVITPAVTISLIVSAFVAHILPSQRMDVIKDMKKMLAGYVTTLFGYRYIIILISGVSSEDLSAAFNQSLPSTSGTAMLGWMQTILWIAAIMTPVGFIAMQLKKISQFIGARKKSDAIREIRDIRNNQRQF